MQTNIHIDNAIANGYDFDISSYFNRGYNIFKKNPGGYIGYTLLYFLISLIVSLIPLIGTLISLIISPSLQVGIPIAAHIQEKYGNEQFSNFWKGFDFVGQLIVTYLVQLAFYLLLIIPFVFYVGFDVIEVMSSGDPERLLEMDSFGTSFALAVLCMVIVFIYIAISLRWAFYLVVFHSYSAIDAIINSWKLVNKKFFWHLIFMILFFFAIIGGFLALVVGIIFVFPIIMAVDYAAFADVTGLNRIQEDNNEVIISEDFV